MGGTRIHWSSTEFWEIDPVFWKGLVSEAFIWRPAFPLAPILLWHFPFFSRSWTFTFMVIKSRRPRKPLPAYEARVTRFDVFMFFIHVLFIQVATIEGLTAYFTGMTFLWHRISYTRHSLWQICPGSVSRGWLWLFWLKCAGCLTQLTCRKCLITAVIRKTWWRRMDYKALHAVVVIMLTHGLGLRLLVSADWVKVRLVLQERGTEL